MFASKALSAVALTLASTLALNLVAPRALATPKAKPLALEVFTAGGAGFHATSTLIKGEKEAVLIDVQFTRSEAHRLTATILESGLTLSTIFVTHAHPDHFFGLEIVMAQFPNAKVVATADVVQHIKELAPKKLAEWKPLYGNNLTDTFVVPETLTGSSLTLEGRKIQIVELPEGESEVAAAVYVPSLKALIAGDLVFNGVHMWLAEGRTEQWLANLERIKSVGPITTVVAGHKKPGAKDSVKLLDQNASYIRNAMLIIKSSKTPEEALARITARYPDHQLPIIAEIAVKALMAN